MTGAQTSIFLEPTDAAFHDVAASVHLSVEPGISALVRAGGDHCLKPASPEIVPDAGVAVAFVSRHALRTRGPARQTRTRAAGRRRRVPAGGLPGRQSRGAVSCQIRRGNGPTRDPAVHRGAGFFPPPPAARLARMGVASTHHRSKSMRPSASRRICSRWRMRSSVPSRCQRRKRS